jgi:hypothetical protein
MTDGPVNGRAADRCYDCKHMRRFHHYGFNGDYCTRCRRRNQTQNRSDWRHEFVKEPREIERMHAEHVRKEAKNG